MRHAPAGPPRLLPDGTPLSNRLLTALPADAYSRVLADLRMRSVAIGAPLHEHGRRIRAVYFPNGGVFSVTNAMRGGQQVEVATVGSEGMLGVGVFLGDRLGTGRTFLQVVDGRLPSMTAARFSREAALPGPFRDLMGRYAQAYVLQVMQGTACNALHDVTQRCCRWLLQTQDRVIGEDFALKQQFLAIMLGVRRPTVTVIMGKLEEEGLVTTRYGRIRVLNRKLLEKRSCECYEVVRAHFRRLKLQ
jgi:CRP-like cAMP-binding protein